MKALLIEFDGGTGRRPLVVEGIQDIGSACTVAGNRCLVHRSTVDENTKCPSSGLDDAAWQTAWLTAEEIRRQPKSPANPKFIGSNHRKLQCYGWQKMGQTPCQEVRVFEVDWDVTPFEGVVGVTVLYNDAEIDAAIAQLKPPICSCQDELLMKADLEQRGILLQDVSGDTPDEVYANLKAMGVKGIAESGPQLVAAVYGTVEERIAKGLPE